MNNSIKNSDSKSEDKKQISQSISTHPIQDEPKQSPSNEPMVVLPSGKKFSQERYKKIKAALNLSGSLRLPDDIVDDGSYHYFWASTQYEGQIQKKQALGYEKCLNKNSKEYRHFASMEGSIRHEHILMRIKKEDRDLISEIQREKAANIELDRITKNLDSDAVFENKTRLNRDGEVTLEEGIQNKYNSNKIKQI